MKFYVFQPIGLKKKNNTHLRHKSARLSYFGCFCEQRVILVGRLGGRFFQAHPLRLHLAAALCQQIPDLGQQRHVRGDLRGFWRRRGLQSVDRAHDQEQHECDDQEVDRNC
jgi:hypothetical protein